MFKWAFALLIGALSSISYAKEAPATGVGSDWFINRGILPGDYQAGYEGGRAPSFTRPGDFPHCGPNASVGYCPFMHPENADLARAVSPFRRAIEDSKNPDVSVAKYLEIEKDYAKRGEPLNVQSLVGLMAHLAENPKSTCEFDALKKTQGYGLVCSGKNKKEEFPGLTSKLLQEHFAKNSLESVVVDDTLMAKTDGKLDKTEETEEETGLPDDAIIPASVANDEGIRFEDSLESNPSRGVSSIEEGSAGVR